MFAGEAVQFDVTDAMVGDGTYTFALRSDDNNNVIYLSREAGDASAPLLTLVADGHAPSATITAPADGSQVSHGHPRDVHRCGSRRGGREPGQ